MFWNKKKSKSKPQIKTPTPKPIKTKEPPPKWEPPFGETKKKEVKIVKCKSCGAKNTVVEGETKECEYCGTLLQ